MADTAGDVFAGHSEATWATVDSMEERHAHAVLELAGSSPGCITTAKHSRHLGAMANGSEGDSGNYMLHALGSAGMMVWHVSNFQEAAALWVAESICCQFSWCHVYSTCTADLTWCEAQHLNCAEAQQRLISPAFPAHQAKPVVY